MQPFGWGSVRGSVNGSIGWQWTEIEESTLPLCLQGDGACHAHKDDGKDAARQGRDVTRHWAQFVWCDTIIHQQSSSIFDGSRHGVVSHFLYSNVWFYSRVTQQAIGYSLSHSDHSHLSLAQSHLLEVDHSVLGSQWRWYCWWVRGPAVISAHYWLLAARKCRNFICDLS